MARSIHTIQTTFRGWDDNESLWDVKANDADGNEILTAVYAAHNGAGLASAVAKDHGLQIVFPAKQTGETYVWSVEAAS